MVYAPLVSVMHAGFSNTAMQYAARLMQYTRLNYIAHYITLITALQYTELKCTRLHYIAYSNTLHITLQYAESYNAQDYITLHITLQYAES